MGRAGVRMVRRLAGMCVAVVAMALIAGCGGGGDDAAEAAADGTTSAATSTVATTSTAVTATTPTATAVTFDPESVLPTLAEMPTGWVKDDQGDDDNTLCDTHIFDSADAVAEVTYSDQGRIPQLGVKAGSFPPGGAVEAMSSGRATFDSCKQFDADGVKWTVSPASFPALGDESIAYLGRAEVEGINVAALFTVVRSGDGVVGVVYGDFASVDTAAVEGYARTAVKRLKAAQQ